MIVNEKVAKSCTEFSCEKCCYITNRKSSYAKHLTTSKHLSAMNGNTKVAKSCNPYICQYCKKEYKDSSGLWRHNKNCAYLNDNKEVEEPTDKQLIMMLIKENTDLKSLMMEVIKNGVTNNSHNSHTNNSHNKSFNLQFFLNETCKDAMNIMEFVDSIQLQLADLEKVGELGYVEGISNIIVKNLNNLDVTQRPIHCTDKKREVLYVKDENKWEKEDEQNSKVRRIIKKVAFKNSSLLRTFREKYPEYKDPQSKVSDRYNKFIIEAMGGKGNDEGEKENRIIKNITKVVSIEKENEPVA
jgi:hypothetical protein